MADHDDFDTDDFDDDEPEQQPNWRRNLERKASKAAKSAEEATKRAEKAERQLAFAKAGVSLSDPKTKYFVNGYDGDLTPEAIRTAAIEAGYIEDDEEPVQQVTDDEVAARRRMSNPESQPAAGRDFHAEMNAANSAEELDRIYLESGGQMAQGYAPGQN